MIFLFNTILKAFIMQDKYKFYRSKSIHGKWLYIYSLIMITVLRAFSQTGNHVPSAAEAANYGTISLITPSGTSWSTARTATPGFFSAVGTATFTGADDANNINGYVKHYVTAANQGFSFPVGTGTALRTLATSGTIANNTVYATAWITGDPTTVADPTDTSPGTHAITAVGTGITAVSNVGQWDWIVNSGSANGVTVTVTIPDMTAFGAATDLRLVGWNGTQWVNLSGATGASGNSAGSTLAGTMIDGITAIGIGKGSAATDTDGDGVADATDQDDDNDGIPDATEGTGDTDGDGVPDNKDLDADNDGINDVREAGGTDANGDGKQDGTPNATTGQIGTALTPPNSDNDPLPDYKDLDSDNDAVSDYQEKGGTLGTDADNDGVVDGPDADADGIPNSVDAFTGFGDASDPTPVNTDGADTPDYRDPDSDNNGTMDIAQKAGKGALDANNDGQVDSPTDPDGDGIPNNGTPALDSKPTAFGGLPLATPPTTDTDGDGVPDDTDQDDDNDGIPDTTEGTGDTDGDGVSDNKDLDADNDGINDVIEAGGTDANGDGKQDGTPNATTGQIGTGLTPPDTDGDTKPDYKDLDSDNDAVSDLQEGGSNGTDADNDGVVDGPDADGDGIPNSVDGLNGSGDANSPALTNTDGTDVPDYRDPDSDNNGTMDIVQKANKGSLDANNDGKVDSPTDPDGDGVANNGGLDSKPAAFGGLGAAAGPAPVDLFPNFTFGGSSFTASASKSIVININETKGAATSGTIEVFVPFSTGFTFNFNGTATTVTVVGPETVNNTDWTVTTTATGLKFTSKAGVSIPANGRSRIGLSITANTAGTDGTITANVTPLSSETNAFNNIAVVGISIQN